MDAASHQGLPVSASRGSTPVAAVLLFTFLNSIGSAIVYSGIFSLAKHAYGFTPSDNFLLGVLYGVTYIPGALLVGPLLRRLPPNSPVLSPRSVLAALMSFMAALCLLPWTATRVLGPDHGTWPMWTLVGAYSAASGMMWPLVESFLSGGRSERELRAATGRFNVAWSSPLVITMLIMGPLVERHALTLLLVLAAVHVLDAALLFTFKARPGAHPEHSHSPPPVYSELLGVFRLLLPAAFLVLSALSPYLTTAAARLELSVSWETWLAAAWMAPRVLTFFTLERWHGWHGRWSMPVVGGVLLLLGFGLAVMSPTIPSLPLARTGAFTGLVILGAGIGTIYTGALYYAMEAGSSEVEAGGTHEALIGLGYTVGPLCGVLTLFALPPSPVPDRPPSGFEPIMLALVAICALFLAGLAAWRVWRRRHPVPVPPPAGGVRNPLTSQRFDHSDREA